jgi:hypothetical protein
MGSLPFSTTKKVNNDLDPVGFHKIDSCVHETKALKIQVAWLLMKQEVMPAGFMKNADTDVRDLKESSTLVGCSMRDLMRESEATELNHLTVGLIGIKGFFWKGSKEMA